MANETTERRVKKATNFPVVPVVIAMAILVGVVLAVSRLFEWERPVITLESDVAVLGQKSKVVATITDQKSGLREVRAIVRQGNKEAVLVDRQLGRATFLSKGLPSLQETIEIDAAALGLHDGPGELLVSARDLSWWGWLRGNQAAILSQVTFDTKPPRLRLVDASITMKTGGSAFIVYGASEEIFDHGVKVEGVFHPGFPIPTRKDGVYGAMIAIPYDVDSVKEAVLIGKDRAGNQASQPINLKVRAVHKKTASINVSDDFLNTKIPEFEQYYPEMKGTNLEKYLFVNNEIRKRNAAKIKELCSHTDPERHWQGHFARLERSSPMAGFAEYRSYFYQGKEIDNQVHLGVDLASLQRAEVTAANNGKVVYSDYLGIYGNMVMIDHGQGVFSLYSHMSELRAKVGEMVKTGDVLGLTGTTGMAGGDHLHFSILINGVFVTPVEWWDDHWIKDNVMLFMQDPKTN